MEPIMFVFGWTFFLLLLHLWGRSTFVGAWAGVFLLLTAVWLATNPPIVKVGETTTYTYEIQGTVAGVKPTAEVNTTAQVDIYGPLPELWGGAGFTWSQIMAFMLFPISVYMIFWNALHPRK